jgi:hypothetical protein
MTGAQVAAHNPDVFVNGLLRLLLLPELDKKVIG